MNQLPPDDRPAPLCACGCGKPVNHPLRISLPFAKFLTGHHVRVKHPRGMLGKKGYDRGPKIRYDVTCAHCGAKFQSTLRETKFCDQNCYSQAISGAGSHFWKGGKQLEGYRHLWINGHSVKEHRVVMEKKLGRKLRKRERVHHMDGNKSNNIPENLHLFHCEGCHQYYHSTRTALVYIYGEVH